MDARIINELIIQAASGDRDSFAEIYEMTKNYVYRTVHFLLSDKSEVDDTVQEIYINLLKSLKKFDTTMPFKPWLTCIMMRKISDTRRKKWKLVRILERIHSFRQIPAPDPMEAVELKQLYGQLLNQIEELSPKLKDVVLLRYVHGFSQEEVAKILDIPVGTVKSRMNSALIKLRTTDGTPTCTYLKEGKVDVF